IGILLVNSGTPQAAQAGAVRAFLARFLADPRVVELPRALWLPLLYGVILPWRPRRVARKYRLIWTASGSPLRDLSERLRAELAGAPCPSCASSPTITSIRATSKRCAPASPSTGWLTAARPTC